MLLTPTGVYRLCISDAWGQLVSNCWGNHGELSWTWSMLCNNSRFSAAWWPAYCAVNAFHCMHSLLKLISDPSDLNQELKAHLKPSSDAKKLIIMPMHLMTWLSIIVVYLRFRPRKVELSKLSSSVVVVVRPNSKVKRVEGEPFWVDIVVPGN